ncbi:Arginine/serine-rich protein PNISR [Nymphon striatum]|nr:Arginine/serine-rich protein PNISR [Nymphon striatum]
MVEKPLHDLPYAILKYILLLLNSFYDKIMLLRQILIAKLVDWGALAQQWIQMQHQPQDQPQQQPTLQQSLPLQVIPANPIANIPIPNQFNSSSEPIEHVPPTGNAYSESGNVLPPAQQSNYWNAEQLTWNNPTLTNQAWLGPNARQKETFDYGHNPSQGESFSSSNSAQTYDYNHRGSNNFTYDQPSYNDQYWEQDSAEPVDVEFNKNRSSWKEVCLPETPQIDMVKRKSLPPWIREGLEKMEREKLKKIDEENEKLLKLKSQNDKVDVGEEKVESVWPKRSRFESESEEDNPADENKSVNENSNDESPSHPIVRSPSPKEVPVMTEEEKEQERLSKMRRWLTEILLEVTNEEIRKVVLEVTEKAISRQ